MQELISIKDDEEHTYTIGPGTQRPLKVTIKGVPPCLFCGEPVVAPSMNGPLVCPNCDQGVNKDGSAWSSFDYGKRRAHYRQQIEAYQRDLQHKQGS